MYNGDFIKKFSLLHSQLCSFKNVEEYLEWDREVLNVGFHTQLPAVSPVPASLSPIAFSWYSIQGCQKREGDWYHLGQLCP